jgi:hypothetical protein
MAEVLVEFNTLLPGENGRRYTPRACTRLGDDGLWEGWIEFVPRDGPGEPLRTGRETEQHDRNGALYWARGLTQVYLEGALKRAQSPSPVIARPTQVAAEPLFDGPRRPSGPSAPVTGRRPLLNPFEVYQQGEDILASELSALRAPRLRDIAIEYGFATVDEADALTAPQLAATIVAGVRRPVASPRREQQPPSSRA